MASSLAAAVANKGDPAPPVESISGPLIEALVRPLAAGEPQASPAAEAAFVLSALCLAEERPLVVIPPSDDLDGPRLKGDRATSASLSEMLAGYHVPATEGVLQSSTYRHG